MKIIYNQKIEVSRKAYLILVKNFGGIICHKKENGKYYIKVWAMKYASVIEEIILKHIQQK